MVVATRKFRRHVEQFTCEACGYEVQGNGYTNHCPKCFVSKHVDVQPGDRAAHCGGLMPVVAVFFLHGQWRLTHQCQTCGEQKHNRVQSADDMEFLAKLSERLIRTRTRG